MRSFTNLSRPYAAYNIDVRSVGEAEHLLTAVAIDWSFSPTAVPVTLSVVHLNVRPTRTKLKIDERSLSIGFHTTAIESIDETEAQLTNLDNALDSVHRSSTILAGHRLQDDLAQVMRLTNRRLLGVQGVNEAWTGRQTEGCGNAHMVDTWYDVAADEQPKLDVSTAPLTIFDDGRPRHNLAAVAAVRSLARCLAIGLVAGVHTRRFHWKGTLSGQAVIARAAPDLFGKTACLADR